MDDISGKVNGVHILSHRTRIRGAVNDITDQVVPNRRFHDIVLLLLELVKADHRVTHTSMDSVHETVIPRINYSRI